MSYIIEVRFHGGLSQSQQVIFEQAAQRWAEVILSDQLGPFASADSQAHLVIDAQGADLGGVGGILGQAGPTSILRDTGRPVQGFMEFDIADLGRLEAEGGLFNTIVHEMGHVLGLGTLWSQHSLVHRSNTDDPVYVGIHAAVEYGRMLGMRLPMAVPLENTGGSGTREGHWRELIFNNELMTGFLNDGHNPLSRLSIAGLQDLGYQVNLTAADQFDFAVPITRPNGAQRSCCGNSPTITILSSTEAERRRP